MGKKKEKPVEETESLESADSAMEKVEQTETVVEEISITENGLIAEAEKEEKVEENSVAEQEPVLENTDEDKKSKKGKKKKLKNAKKERKPVHPLTLTAFILSIVFFFFNGALIAPIIPIVLAIVGLVKGKKKDMGGKALGIVAIVLSAIALVFASGEILVATVKGVYIIWMLIQGGISLFTEFDGNIFAFLGRILQIANDVSAQISSRVLSGLHIKTLYYYLNGAGDREAAMRGTFEIFGIKFQTIHKTISVIVDRLFKLGENLGFPEIRRYY